MKIKRTVSHLEIGRDRPGAGVRKPRAADSHSSAGARLRFPGAHHTWMAVLLIVMIGQVEKWVPGITGLPLAKVAFLITAFYVYRERHTLLPVRVRSLRIAKPALAFFALGIFSVAFSIYKSNTLQLVQANIVLIVAFVVLVKITQTIQDVERMMFALAASAILLTLGVLLNYKGGRAHINSDFDPNDVAYSLDTLLPIVVAVGVARSNWLKWSAYGTAVAIACAIFLTGSLGGVIGFGVVVFAMLAYPVSLSATGEPKKPALRRMILQVGVISVLGVAIWGHLPSATRARLSGVTDLQNNYNVGDSQESRMVIWRTELELALERPIGYGMGSAAAADGIYGGGAYFTSHNSLIEAFIELGALGLWLFLYAYYIAWKELGVVLRASHEALRDRGGATGLLYARGLRIALIGNIVSGFFLSEAYSYCMWMVLAVCAALVYVVTSESRATDRAPRMKGSGRSDGGGGAEGSTDAATRRRPGRGTGGAPLGPAFRPKRLTRCSIPIGA